MDSKTQTIEIHVQLLDEGSVAYRPTRAIPLENGLYKVLATPLYDSQVETWEFPPGSVVRVKESRSQEGEPFLMAIKA